MEIRIIEARTQEEAKRRMSEIGVDPGGILIMSPKAESYLIKIKKLFAFGANILKQDALSLGADAAISRDALTGKTKYTDALIIANAAQIDRLCEKIKSQPFGLAQASLLIKNTLTNYQRKNFIFRAGRKVIDLRFGARVMGIINATPDSFSGDGLYKNQKSNIKNQILKNKNQKFITAEAVNYALKLVEDGADIIDIGGESTRPGARPVSLKEELKRVIPVIKILSKKIKVPISVDTYKSEVARRALDNGVSIINDITALRGDCRMSAVVKKYKAAVVLMHMQGHPRGMQNNPKYGDVVDEVISFLSGSIEKAQNAGIAFEKIIVDPGIGFGKTPRHNLEIIRRLNELKILGRPILAGVSRKSFISKVLNVSLRQRLAGTISAVCACAASGASIVRVHDVKEVKQALKVLEAIG